MEKSDSKSSPSFEQSLQQLEAIVRQLEEGQLGLSEGLAEYERGIKLLKRCYDALEVAERRIEKLSGVDADGNPITEPFDEQDVEGATPARKLTKRRPRAAKPSREDDVDDNTTLF